MVEYITTQHPGRSGEVILDDIDARYVIGHFRIVLNIIILELLVFPPFLA
jgi:hypothetical protein